MKKLLHENPVAKTHAETANPLWIITVMLAIFFAAAAALIGLG